MFFKTLIPSLLLITAAYAQTTYMYFGPLINDLSSTEQANEIKSLYSENRIDVIEDKCREGKELEDGFSFDLMAYDILFKCIIKSTGEETMILKDLTITRKTCKADESIVFPGGSVSHAKKSNGEPFSKRFNSSFYYDQADKFVARMFKNDGSLFGSLKEVSRVEINKRSGKGTTFAQKRGEVYEYELEGCVVQEQNLFLDHFSRLNYAVDEESEDRGALYSDKPESVKRKRIQEKCRAEGADDIDACVRANKNYTNHI